MPEDKMENSVSKNRRRRKKKPAAESEQIPHMPTDTKVVIVKESNFNLLKGDTGGKSDVSEQKPINLADDFPQLGEPSSSAVVPLSNPWIVRHKSGTRTPKVGVSADTSLSHLVTVVSPRSFRNESHERELLSASRSRKSKRPINLELSSLLQVRGQKTIGRGREHHRKTSHKAVAAVVAMKKGKQRENKKIRLSRLKTCIMMDRLIRKEAKMNLAEKDKPKDPEVTSNKPDEGPQSGEGTTESRQPETNTSISSNKIFSNKFRSYCENVITPELNQAVETLVKSLVHLQDNAFARDPIRARAKKRFVTGLREAAKYLKLKKVKMLIVAPDLEASSVDGALGKFIAEMKEIAKEVPNVPCVFALGRRKLGYASLRKAPVSAFAVLSYDGLEAQFDEVTTLLNAAREEFEASFTSQSSTQEEDLILKPLLALSLQGTCAPETDSHKVSD